MNSTGSGGPAVFLDRDGVVNAVRLVNGNPVPPANPGDFRILPDVAAACHLLKSMGFRLVVATNQPDVGRGTLSQAAVEQMHHEMCRLLPIDHVEVCFAAGNEAPPCVDRKPLPGMLLRAAGLLQIDISSSWMIGDRWKDVRCGQAAGCRTIFIDRHYAEATNCVPDFIAADLQEAAAIIRNEVSRLAARLTDQRNPGRGGTQE